MKCSKKDFLCSDILIVFFLAFIARWIVAVFCQELYPLKIWEYENIAVNLFNGKGFLINFIGADYYAYSTPLYPMLCAAVYKIFGHNQFAIVLLQIAISSFLCVFVYLLTLNIFKQRSIAVVSSILAIIHPGLIVYSALHLHAFTLDAFLIFLTAFCFIMLFNNLTLIRSFICGIIYGLCALTRSTIIPFLFTGIIWLFYAKKEPIKKILSHSLILIVIGVIIIGTWSFRNFIVFKRFIPITTVSAEVFWRGNNVNASGTSFTSTGETVLRSDSKLFSKVKVMNEIQRYDFFKSEAKNFVKTHPARFASLTLKKFFYFWWFSPDSGKFYPKNFFDMYKYGYSLMLLFSIVGIFTGLFSNQRHVSKKSFLLCIALLTISLGQSFFYIEGRHRVALEPLLLVFTASGLFYTKEKFKKCLKTRI